MPGEEGGVEEASEAAPSSVAAAPAGATGAAVGEEPAKVDVDDAQPTVSLQIRLGDGTRMVSRFNTTHTVGDVYDFVTRASPSSQGRGWTLMTTFPSKPLNERSAALGDTPELKKGGTVIQKWS